MPKPLSITRNPRNPIYTASYLRGAAGNGPDDTFIEVPRWAVIAAAEALEEVETIQQQIDEAVGEVEKEHEEDDIAFLGDIREQVDEINDMLTDMAHEIAALPESNLGYDLHNSWKSIRSALKELRGLV